MNKKLIKILKAKTIYLLNDLEYSWGLEEADIEDINLIFDEGEWKVHLKNFIYDINEVFVDIDKAQESLNDAINTYKEIIEGEGEDEDKDKSESEDKSEEHSKSE